MTPVISYIEIHRSDFARFPEKNLLQTNKMANEVNPKMLCAIKAAYVLVNISFKKLVEANQNMMFINIINVT